MSDGLRIRELLDTAGAGRELDALVARRVMGWTRKADPTWNDLPDFMTPPGREDFDLFPVPTYSTDIAAAWAVVEKMERDGWRWSVDRRGDDEFAIAWRFHRRSAVYRADEPTVSLAICRADEPTVPLAICRAALATASNV